jgi:Phosphodiester glycosidase
MHEALKIKVRACAGTLVIVTLLLGQAHGRAAPAAAAGRRYVRWSSKIARGLRLIGIRDTAAPNRIRVLKVNPARRLTIDVALSNDRIPGYETTTSMAARKGAIAAINGDYTFRAHGDRSGRPVDTFAEDGHLVASPLIWGINFALSQDERHAYLGHADLAIEVRELDSGATWTIDRWNGSGPARDEVVGYTRVGGATFGPPSRACSARLYPFGHISWGSGGTGVVKDYVVDEVRCGRSPLPRQHGVVLSAREGSTSGERVAALVAGQRLRLRWSLGWKGVLDTIGGNPALVKHGRIVLRACGSSYFCGRNPRTGVGIKRNGKVLLVTVDGRQPGSSVGMSLKAFAHLFRRLGARWAVNLDGGGSTTMVVRNKIVNRPSGSSERAVGSALLVLPRSDADEPDLSRGADVVRARAPVGSGRHDALSPDDPYCLALEDPGSTGGLLDALARGDLPSPGTAMSRPIARAVAIFRGRRSCSA